MILQEALLQDVRANKQIHLIAMADIVNLFVQFKEHGLYPHNREFTEYEAWLDILITYFPSGRVTDSLSDLASSWRWNKSKVARFLESLEEQKLLARDLEGWHVAKADKWYKMPEEVKPLSIENAQRVVDEYNRVFKRKVQLNDYRARTICARIKEGRKADPPISINDFRLVFEYKRKEWGEDQEMARHLVLETLCARKYFLKYLEQAREAKKGDVQATKMTGSILSAR